MTYMLNDIDEAIDRKFLVTKSLSNQVEAGTIVHIMDAVNEKDGSVTVYYRITYTKQDYTVKFENLKQFCKWARPDNFIARHYESFDIKEIQQYIKMKDRTFMSFYLPIILVALVIIWAVALILKKPLFYVVGGILSAAVIGLVIYLYKVVKHRTMIRLYSKISSNSNWGVNFK
ncbi:MAG: hypothetical protein IK130_09600 [Oscillospiraceae bacterium]|nr:hypothetical protein [Oscillospiraceae bacterium]